DPTCDDTPVVPVLPTDCGDAVLDTDVLLAGEVYLAGTLSRAPAPPTRSRTGARPMTPWRASTATSTKTARPSGPPMVGCCTRTRSRSTCGNFIATRVRSAAWRSIQARL